MSNVVDDRVVKMKFDNEQFEQGVNESLKSINDLDKSLKDLDKGAYGGNLGSALSGIGSAVDDVADRFSAWGIVGMEVIQRLTDFAIDRGAEMAKALTVDNVIAGWQKYEDLSSNIYAIANQVSNGETFDDVTRAVEKLSWYSDATSFSLSDMTSALKGFVAQGIDLDTATSMIMGMGNSITYAGANAKEGSGAFQVFAKSLGQGYIGLRQWQQLSTTYGIATYELKQQALDTAVAMGKLTVEYNEMGEAIYETEEGLSFTLEDFETTLGNQKGKWLDKDVMTALYGSTGQYGEYISGLAEYIQMIKETTGEQLTWNEATERYGEFLSENGMVEDEFGRAVADSATVAKTLTEAIDAVKDAASSQWERIFQGMFGAVDKAKVVWSDFSDWLNGIFVGPLNNVANIVTAWSELPKELGGQDSFLQIFRNIAKAAENMVAPIKRAWSAIYGDKTTQELAEKLGGIILSIEKFTESLILNEGVASKIQRVWEVVFEILKTVGTAIDKIWNLLKAAGSVIKPVIGFLGELVGGIAEVLDVIFKVFNMDGNLWNWLLGPTNALKRLGASLTDTFAIFDIVKTPVIKGVSGVFKDVANAAGDLTGALDDTGSSLSQLWDNFKKSEGYSKFMDNLSNAKAELYDFGQNFSNTFSEAYKAHGGGVAGTAAAVYETIKSGVSSLYESLIILLDGHFAGVTDKIKTFATWAETKVKEVGATIKAVASNAWTQLTGGLFGDGLLGNIDETNEAAAGELTMLEKIRSNIEREVKGTQAMGNAMTNVMGAVGAFSIGDMLLRIRNILKNISGLFDSMSGTFGSIGKYFDTLTLSLKNMQLELKADIIKDIALAILVLAGSLFVMSQVDTDKLLPALGVMTALMTEMGLLMFAINKMDFGNSVVEYSGISEKFTSTSSGMSKAATSILKLTAGVLVLAEAMKAVSDIPKDQLLASWAAISSLMLELVVFAKMTDGAKGGLSGNVGMNIFKMASGLVVIAQAMKMLAELDDENNSLGKGLGAVGGILTMLFTFSAAMDKWGGGKDIGDMGSLIALAAGLAALALVIKTFSNIPTENLIKGGVAVAACLTAVGVFMHAMTEANVNGNNMIKISAAMVIFAAGLEVMALAMLTMNLVQWDSIAQAAVIIGGFAIAAIALEPASYALISFAAAVALFGVGIAGIGAGLLAFATAMTLVSVELPVFVAGIITTLSGILIGIASLKPEIVAAVVSLVEAICEAIIGSIDMILTTFDTVAIAFFEHLLSTLAEICTIIEKYWPTIKATLSKVGTSIINKLKEWAPKVWNWVKETAGKIAQIVRENWKDWLLKLGQFLLSLLLKFGEFALSGLAALGEFLLGLVGIAIGKLGDFLQAGKDLVHSLWEGFTSKFEDAKREIGEFIQDIIDGILGFLGSIFDAGKSLIDSLLGGVRDKDEEVYLAGEETAGSYNKGVNEGKYEAKRAGETLGSATKSGIEETNLYTVGFNMIKGFIAGLGDKGAVTDLKDKSSKLGKDVKKTLENTLEIASPSKVTEYIGKMATKGLAQGLMDRTEYNNVILSAYGLGGGTVQYTIEGLKSKWPDLFDEIDEMGDEAAEHSKEAGKKITDAFTEEVDMTPTISVVIDTKNFDERLNYISTKLEAFKAQRLDELSLGDAASSDKIEELDKEIDMLEKQRKEVNAEYMANMGLGSSINYDIRDANINMTSAEKMLAAGLGTGIDYKFRDSGLEQPKGEIKQGNATIVNQTILSPDPADPVQIYRSTKTALASRDMYINTAAEVESARVQPYYDPVTGKYLN